MQGTEESGLNLEVLEISVFSVTWSAFVGSNYGGRICFVLYLITFTAFHFVKKKKNNYGRVDLVG